MKKLLIIILVIVAGCNTTFEKKRYNYIGYKLDSLHVSRGDHEHKLNEALLNGSNDILIEYHKKMILEDTDSIIKYRKKYRQLIKTIKP